MSKERVKAYRLRQKELKRLPRCPYLTDDEWVKVQVFITRLRKDD